MDVHGGKRIAGLFIADIHWMTRKPEYRSELVPFHQVIEQKIKSVVQYPMRDTPVFVAGDVFDRARDFMDLWTFRNMLSGLFEHEHKMYSVRGQHDMFHHNKDNKATTYNEVARSSVSFLPMAGSSPVVLKGNIKVYGAGWGDEVPTPENKDDKNILLWHKTLWYRKPPYPGITDGNVSVESVRLYELGYKMVFSGDNHRAFDATIGGLRFINLGALTRKSTDLADQRPRFAVLLEDMTVDFVEVGEHDVFDLERSTADKKRVVTRDGFSDALAGGFVMGDTFKPALERAVDEGSVGELTLNDKQREVLRDIINSI